MKLDWADFKTFCSTRSVPMHSTILPQYIMLLAFDGPLAVECTIYNGSADYTDYIDNYQSSANVSMTDSNGISLARTKITKSGWHYQIHGTEFTSAKLNSIYNKDEDGNDLGFTTIKYYDVNDVELVAGTQAELDTDCVKTVFTWEPDQDIDVIGGVLEQPTPTTNDVRLWVTAIPDLPAPNGSVPFTTGGINLKYISGNIDIDGKTAKTLPYNATYHTNKFRITVRHDAGDKYPVHMLFKIYLQNGG